MKRAIIAVAVMLAAIVLIGPLYAQEAEIPRSPLLDPWLPEPECEPPYIGCGSVALTPHFCECLPTDDRQELTPIDKLTKRLKCRYAQMPDPLKVEVPDALSELIDEMPKIDISSFSTPSAPSEEDMELLAELLRKMCRQYGPIRMYN